MKHSIKRTLFLLAALVTLSFASSSCATIIGGTTYTAKVVAKDHPDATIKVNGETKGVGTASFEWQRDQADRLSITLSEEGCEEQTTNFNTKSFRWLPLLGNVFIVGGIPGIIVDLATQSIWKPNVKEPGVSKINFETYLYEIIYDKCPPKKDVQLEAVEEL